MTGQYCSGIRSGSKPLGHAVVVERLVERTREPVDHGLRRALVVGDCADTGASLFAAVLVKRLPYAQKPKAIANMRAPATTIGATLGRVG